MSKPPSTAKARQFLEWVQKPTTWRMLHDVAGAELYQHLETNFEREQDPYNIAWVQSLRARLEGGKTMYKSGNLRRRTTYTATPRHVRLSNRTKYAPYHQQNPTRGGGSIAIRAKTDKGLRFKVGGKWATRASVVLPQRRVMFQAGERLPSRLERRITLMVSNIIRRRFEASK